uniref:Fucosyltransferase n=1 Tax=Acrobeloides nanus TaxID=290746 RepID=A0A914BUP6_9BILA
MILYLLYWFEYVPLINNDHFSRSPNEIPVILYWTATFGTYFHDYIKKNPIDQSDCPYKCIFTDNRSSTEKAKLVIFHVRDLNETDIPTKARKGQFHVFYNMESPYHTGIAYKRVPRNFFDLSMTYRMDSDVLVAYDRFDAIDNETTKEEVWSWGEVQAKVQAKSKHVLQLVSNCHTPSKREAYVERLKRYIKITILGQCTHRACNHATCEQKEIDNHLFYLAFENSICKDYITEKFWQIKNLIVPIVLDRKIYKDIVPVDSFIATNDFDSPSDLARYLTLLAANRTEYLKYFNWTRSYKKQNVNRRISSYCELCKIAHTRKRAGIPDITNWWEKQGECQTNFGMHHQSTVTRREVYN